MNCTTVVRRGVLLATVAVLSACATPKPVRSLADHGATTVAFAEVSLRDYLNATEAQLTARMELLRNESQSIDEERARRELERLFDERAGSPTTEASAKLIRELAEQHQRDREEHAEHMEQIAEAMKFDAETLAKVPTEKLATAKKSFSVLAQELSPQEWVQLASGYAQRISEGIKSLHSEEKSTADGQQNGE
jgi:hypothetical protein